VIADTNIKGSMPGPDNPMDKGELLFTPTLKAADTAEDICGDNESSEDDQEASSVLSDE
jgi:hypothetical protein